MANQQYLNFIGTVWDLLPTEDRERMAETWTGYEQVFASVYQKIVENDLNTSIANLQSYSTERWLSYQFKPENLIARPPIYTSTQDLSLGVKLDNNYLLHFRIDGNLEFEVDVRGVNPLSTKIEEILAKINAAAGFNFARAIFDNTIIQLVSRTPAPMGSIEILVPSNPLLDATEYILGLQLSDLPQIYPKFPYVYVMPYDKVVSVPTFQTRIRDESFDLEMLDENIDFTLEVNNLISFKQEPPEMMWAKKTLIDDETPYHNFGFLMDIYQKNTPSYLQVLQGLWYAYWTGPKPRNLQISLYLLFGLPVAPDDGTVTRVTPTEIDITLSRDGATFTFPVPSELLPIVVLGQSVSKYDPLVNGIDIIDKISKPGFIEEDIGRAGIQRFLLDDATRGPGDTDETKALRMLEEHTFLPQISVESFISPEINLGNVKTFLENIKPLSKTFLFQVIVGNFKEEIAFQEHIGMHLSIDVTPNLDSNQTTFAEPFVLAAYELNANSGLDLDSDGVCIQEEVAVEVFSAGVLIDTFIA